jgi:hypothetical protein
MMLKGSGATMKTIDPGNAEQLVVGSLVKWTKTLQNVQV